MENIMEDTQL
jgi:hypothetical protein